jgi:hypothetical protein
MKKEGNLFYIHAMSFADDFMEGETGYRRVTASKQLAHGLR